MPRDDVIQIIPRQRMMSSIRLSAPMFYEIIWSYHIILLLFFTNWMQETSLALSLPLWVQGILPPPQASSGIFLRISLSEPRKPTPCQNLSFCAPKMVVVVVGGWGEGLKHTSLVGPKSESSAGKCQCEFPEHPWLKGGN